jgi:hypothetical protein
VSAARRGHVAAVTPFVSEWPGLRGLYGRAYIDLEPYLDLAALPRVHDEICLALAQLPLDYTGGSHRSMGIMPSSRADEAFADYGEVIRALDDADFAVFRRLADDATLIDPARRGELAFGEERAVPLSRRQMQWLKVRFGVYFPWKAYLELIPNRWWDEKASAEGKRFTRLAESFLPETIAFVRKLPFEHIGRCNVMGLESFDYGTVHRDGDPAEQAQPDHFITFVPAANKRVFLWDDERRAELPIECRAYWFNDFDYHGVAAAPHFRYSVRVDGVFRPDFLAALARDLGGAT